jgi:ATP-binding cassette subfamily C protein CydCD
MAQHPVLTGATVREAVTVGRAHHDDDVRRALQRAALDLPLDHEIGDEGRALSAGQRRRLALARTLVSEPQLLVLDEPLAHLDDDTARALADTLRSTGITTVLATHRPLDGARVYDVGRTVSA